MKIIIRLIFFAFITINCLTGYSQSLHVGIYQAIPFSPKIQSEHSPVYIADVENSIITNTNIKSESFVKLPGVFIKYNKKHHNFSSDISLFLFQYSIQENVQTGNTSVIRKYNESVWFTGSNQQTVSYFGYGNINYAYFPFIAKKFDLYFNIGLSYNLLLNKGKSVKFISDNDYGITTIEQKFHKELHLETLNSIPVLSGFGKIGIGVEYYLLDFNLSFNHNITSLSNSKADFLKTINYFEFSVSYTIINKYLSELNFKNVIKKEKQKWQ